MLRAALLLLAFGLAANPAPAQNVPPGELKPYTFAASKIFPGTTRTYTLYVPAKYDGRTPACVYVNQDGVQYNAPAVFDRMIEAGTMPVTIGVFVTPGVVPAANADSLPRFNRSFEYDGLGDAYARFILDELLPDVEKKSTADGRPIRLSKKPGDRAIGGASSGAVCAFTAAWERPDGFTRVFSSIGTYVGLRGGHSYPTLIRKTEPKPIRVFLQDGENDLNIWGGDWWMANQEMERALKFAGYEVEHAWGQGGHDGKHATEIFPAAMKFLWKGWPEAPKAGLGSPQMKDLLVPGEKWELVGEGFKFTEGPATNEKGEVYFNDVGSSRTLRVGPDGPFTWLKDSKRGDGQRFGPDGRLYANTRDGDAGKLLAWDSEGNPQLVAEGFKGNDLVVARNGSIYVTDPFTKPGASAIWHVSKTGEKTIVDTGLNFANGITLSPDQSLLYVADSRTHWVYSWQIQANGSLAHKQKYFHLHVPDTSEDSGADGLRTDRDGRLWVATKLGLQVCDQAGRVQAILPTPNGKCANLTFGGPDRDVVFVCCGDKVYKRKVKAKGADHAQPPFKPVTPRQ